MPHRKRSEREIAEEWEARVELGERARAKWLETKKLIENLDRESLFRPLTRDERLRRDRMLRFVLYLEEILDDCDDSYREEKKGFPGPKKRVPIHEVGGGLPGLGKRN